MQVSYSKADVTGNTVARNALVSIINDSVKIGRASCRERV